MPEASNELLLGTLANKDISDLRRREAFRRKQPDIVARYPGTVSDTAARALNAIALEHARKIIEDMPPRQKKVALMRWQDHMKASEIAAELGIAESTVHAHLHTARGKLVAGLERYYPFGLDNGKEPSVTSDTGQDHEHLFLADFYPSLANTLPGNAPRGMTPALAVPGSVPGSGTRERKNRRGSRRRGRGRAQILAAGDGDGPASAQVRWPAPPRTRSRTT